MNLPAVCCRMAGRPKTPVQEKEPLLVLSPILDRIGIPEAPVPLEQRREQAAREHGLVVRIEQRQPLRLAGPAGVLQSRERPRIADADPEPFPTDSADAAAAPELRRARGDSRPLARSVRVGPVLLGRELDENLPLQDLPIEARDDVDETAGRSCGLEHSLCGGPRGDRRQVAAVDGPGSLDRRARKRRSVGHARHGLARRHRDRLKRGRLDVEDLRGVRDEAAVAEQRWAVVASAVRAVLWGVGRSAPVDDCGIGRRGIRAEAARALRGRAAPTAQGGGKQRKREHNRTRRAKHGSPQYYCANANIPPHPNEDPHETHLRPDARWPRPRPGWLAAPPPKRCLSGRTRARGHRRRALPVRRAAPSES